jgi:two-component system chemotaxis sensor kinase CheA
MSQFYQVFFEETSEHLGRLESLLLEIDRHAPDAEQLNAIFRAAHSIKGSSATFGFNDLADLTHVLETLLDRVRKGEARLSDEMVQAFLEAGDALKMLLASHRGEAPADADVARLVRKRLECLRDRAESRPLESVSSASLPTQASVSPVGERLRRIRVVFVPALADSPQSIDNLLAELHTLGEVEVVRRPPEDCNPGAPWQVMVTTVAGLDAIGDLVDFVALSGSVSISAEAPDTLREVVETERRDTCLAPPAAPAREDYGFFDERFSEMSVATPSPENALPDAGDSKGSEQRANHGEKQHETRPEPKPASETGSMRVSVEKVDQMINLVGELVITQAMLSQSASTIDPVVHERLLNGLAQLERNTRDLQEAVMSVRMVPISVVFSRFPRVVHDVSRKLGKQVELKTSGESTELDKSLIERITDPLTHLVRNSLDHGIEAPEARQAAGKRPVGMITLKAFHQGGNIVIEVGDDGAGLNGRRILAKARERGLTVNESMSDQDVWQLVFEAGFSTAETVTEVSGRGVGMDVVKRNIMAMGGRVEVDSVKGVGTRVTVRLPLTLAILDGMSVAVAGETYVLPLNAVVESLQATRGMIKSLSGVDRLIQMRGEYIPVITLEEVFGIRRCAKDLTSGIMVVLEANGAKAALYVDALIGQQQVVIKSLEANFRRVAGISGATIMGDGRVAMILDVAAVIGATRQGLVAAA